MENKRNKYVIPKKIQLEVWSRDNWHCRYCHEPIIYGPALKLFDKINPDHKYFHPNGKIGEMLPLFMWSWASVDHVKPFSKQGENNIENYVSACWKCNLKYGNKEIGSGKPKPKKILESEWDGFYELYKKLKKTINY